MHFHTFVCGQNDLALKAAHAVAHKQAVYNPLFIHGPSGSGKTHLLKAIQNYVGEKHPDKKVKYLRGDQFMSELSVARKAMEVDVWHEETRKLDYFLLDDIHIFLEAEWYADAFYHVFEGLYNQGKQLVLTSDLKPREIQGLGDRMLSRLSWGLVAQTPEIGRPEAKKLIHQYAKKHGVVIEREDDISWILDRIRPNARELEGVVVQIAAHVQLSGQEMNAETISQALAEINKNAPKPLRIACDDIIDLVCEHYNVRMNDMLGPGRTKNLATPRHYAMWMIKELTELTLTEIGSFMGGRDHSTVLHAINKVKDIRLRDREIRDELDRLIEKLRFEYQHYRR